MCNLAIRPAVSRQLDRALVGGALEEAPTDSSSLGLASVLSITDHHLSRAAGEHGLLVDHYAFPTVLVIFKT